MEKAAWEAKNLGINIALTCGRITIFRTTLKELGYPPYYRFLLDQEKKQFAIECCEFESSGSHQLPEERREHYDVISIDLVRFIYRLCGWDKKSSYRIKGIAIPSRRMVVFDLAKALRYQEHKMVGES